MLTGRPSGPTWAAAWAFDLAPLQQEETGGDTMKVRVSPGGRLVSSRLVAAGEGDGGGEARPFGIRSPGSPARCRSRSPSRGELFGHQHHEVVVLDPVILQSSESVFHSWRPYCDFLSVQY